METMKRKWGKPVTEVQRFWAQEFCADCKPTVTYTYHADCGQGITFPATWGKDNDWTVWPLSADSDGDGTFSAQEHAAHPNDYLGHWHKCNVSIDGEAHFTNDLTLGFLRPNSSNTEFNDANVIKVYYWYSHNGYHVCDGNVGKDTYLNSQS